MPPTELLELSLMANLETALILVGLVLIVFIATLCYLYNSSIAEDKSHSHDTIPQSQPVDPKVAFVQEHAKKSLRLNLLAARAHRKMAEAAMSREDYEADYVYEDCTGKNKS